MVPSRASTTMCERHGQKTQHEFCSLCSTKTVDTNNYKKKILCVNPNPGEGGSSGLCRYDKEFKMFLHTHGCFPRLSKGIIIVPYVPKDRRLPTLWKCLYFSPYKHYHSALVETSYSPPVQGGKLKLKNHADLLKNFPNFESLPR